jgi:apolipoprotein N-acyltransferase
MLFPFFTIFAAYHALQFGLFALPIRRISELHTPALSAAAIASWWVVLEWCFPRVAPWYLGDTLAASPILRQAADLSGPHGLSFLLVLTNASIALALRRDPVPYRRFSIA